MASPISRVLFRSSLRAVRRLNVALAASENDTLAFRSLLPTVGAVRSTFRAALSDNELFKNATELLQLANRLAAALEAERLDLDETGTVCSNFFIGSTVRHRLHCYRAVIVGYDASFSGNDQLVSRG